MLEKVLSMSAEDKEKLIQAIEQEAKYREMEYGGCARCTLFALQKYLGLCDDVEFEATLRATVPLSGGIAGAGEACGALTGGVMAIGLAYGPAKMESVLADSAARTKHMDASDRAYVFLARFRNEFGSIYCRDICTQLLGKPWQLRNAEYHLWGSQKHIHDKCGEVTLKGARLAAEVIFEPIERIPRLLPPD